jgi:hypothetical protein
VLLAGCGGSQPRSETVLLADSGTGHATETIDSPGEHGWDMHWTYDCAGGGGVFAADVFDSDHTPDFGHPGIYEEGGGGNAGVYHVPGKGRFYLEITTTCAWAVKVVESV